jgi:uncharacterized HAD superfamily protein
MSSKQVIAVDVDDVLAASVETWVAYSNKRWGTNLTAEDYDEDWAKMWSVDRATESQRAQEIYASRIVREFKHYPEAKEVLERLNHKYELVIATSRVLAVRQDTLDWLDKHYGDIFKHVHHSGIYDMISERPIHKEGVQMLTKTKLVQQLGADFLIDDQLKHCVDAAKAGIETILFGNYPWNRLIGRLPARVTRCADWAAVWEYFDARS